MDNKTPPLHRKVLRIAQLLTAAGAADILLVGGYVRDCLLDIPSKDYDLEVYGMDYDAIVAALSPHFRVNQVGKSFSVLKIDNTIDLALPRREVKTGVGHREFYVEADSRMTFQEAAGRRDFTINAIGMRMDGTLCDPYGGHDDLRHKILRAPTEAFCEDPLRVLRAMQFAARFGMDMEPRTVALCRRVLPEFATLSEERIFTEWQKWAAKGDFPEKGLELLAETGWLECFPELHALTGDSFTLTKKRCAEAAKLAGGLPENERVIVMFAALCRDFGDVKTVEAFLMKMKPPLWLVEHVLPLIGSRRPPGGGELPNDAAVRHLSARLAPANIQLWEFLYTADEIAHQLPRGCADWGEKAHQLGVYHRPPEPILLGRHLQQKGISPGPEMGKILKKAWIAQLDGEFSSLEEAFTWMEENHEAER